MNTTSALKFTRLLSYVTMTANGILNISSKIANKATDVVLGISQLIVTEME